MTREYIPACDTAAALNRPSSVSLLILGIVRISIYGFIIPLIGVIGQGCGRTASRDEVQQRLGQDKGAGPRLVTARYDVKARIAQGQLLKHEFFFSNQKVSPIRIKGATALTPCCSSVGLIAPASVAPGSSVAITVSLRAITQDVEAKYVEFVVETDDPECPVRRYGLSARLYPAFEAMQVGRASHVLHPGVPGGWDVEIVTRKIGEDGSEPPNHVSTTPPLLARLTGPGLR